MVPSVRSTTLMCISSLAILIVLAASSSPSHAQQFVGLVTEAIGQIKPRIERYSEVTSATQFQLAPNASLRVTVYSDCEMVHIEGPATVNVLERRLDVAPSEAARRGAVGCPKRVSVRENEAVSGVLVQTISPPQRSAGPTVDVKPSFVVAGPKAKDTAFFSVEKQGGPEKMLEVKSSRAEWPSGGKKLASGQYQLQLFDADRNRLGIGSVMFDNDPQNTSPLVVVSTQ